MILPRKWAYKETGIIDPGLFFVLSCSLAGQDYRLDPESAALGPAL